jgi:uncharacterized protein (TIGR02271 family)
VPSFFCAYEVSCRVRAERVKPYAPKERFTPGPCAILLGSPAPRRHPGARRYGYAVVNLMYTPVTSCCQYFFCQQIQSSLLSSREGLRDEDELRVQRTEEELRAGTREREAGELRVRKDVRTDREQVRVPTRHEEVSVERVPVEGREASEAEIGEDEVTMPVTEDEVVVEKRPVVKEEIRVQGRRAGRGGHRGGRPARGDRCRGRYRHESATRGGNDPSCPGRKASG